MPEHDSPRPSAHTPPSPPHPLDAQTHERIAANIAHVEQLIDEACTSAGRPRDDVRLLPVSKTHPSDLLGVAHELGLRTFAESRPQELSAKAASLSALPGISWVMIGRLQSNKAGLIATHASEFQSLDSLKHAHALQRHLENLNRQLTVTVQVNVSGEDVKAGIQPGQLETFIADLAPLSHLKVSGLMTMAPLTEDESLIRRTFAGLRELRDSVAPNAPDGMSLADLSMGMSGDYALAIEEGATTVRIGRALFGTRSTL